MERTFTSGEAGSWVRRLLEVENRGGSFDERLRLIRLLLSFLPRPKRLLLGAENDNAVLNNGDSFRANGTRNHAFALGPGSFEHGRIEGRKRVLVGQLALIAAALFTGAAVYVNVAEQPARLALDDRASLAEWKAAYHRGFAMQGSLAIIGFSLGLIAARAEMDWRWVPGALLLLANWPFTLIAILPANKLLMEIAPQNAGPKSRELIRAWGRLHAVRCGLGASATVLFLWASAQAWLQ